MKKINIKNQLGELVIGLGVLIFIIGGICILKPSFNLSIDITLKPFFIIWLVSVILILLGSWIKGKIKETRKLVNINNIYEYFKQIFIVLSTMFMALFLFNQKGGFIALLFLLWSFVLYSIVKLTKI